MRYYNNILSLKAGNFGQQIFSDLGCSCFHAPLCRNKVSGLFRATEFSEVRNLSEAISIEDLQRLIQYCRSRSQFLVDLGL